MPLREAQKVIVALGENQAKLDRFYASIVNNVRDTPKELADDLDALLVKAKKARDKCAADLKAAQDALLALLQAADKHYLTETDKEFITAEGVNPPGKDWPATLLDAVVKYHKGNNSDMTWGVWERRLDDSAIRVMAKILGVKTHGRALDEALGGKRYSGKTKQEWEALDAKSKK